MRRSGHFTFYGGRYSMSVRNIPLLLLVSVTFSLLLVACGQVSSAGDSSSAGKIADATTVACTQAHILSVEAGAHVGQEGTVCGRVADYLYLTGERGRPTVLLFDIVAMIERESPTDNQQVPQTFEAVIWKEHAKNFPANFAATYDNKVVCVTGVIETHNDNPAIIVTGPEQLQINCGAG